MAKKKRKVVLESSSESDKKDETKDNNEEEDEEEISQAERERLMALTVLSTHKEPPITNAVPLAAKHPIISYTFRVRDGSEGYWEFKRTNDMYYGFISFSQMLFFMDRDDLVDIWGLYKEKFGATPPENDYEKVIYHNLKIMFEPHVTDREWVEMRGKKVNKWFLYHSCGVHELSVGGVTVFLLVEKDYPGLNANREILTQMIRPGFLKLQNHFMSDHQAYKLLQKYEKILDPSLRKSFHKKK